MSTASVLTGRRAVTVKHEITGTLEAVTALRVGGWGPSADADLVVVRDGLGRLVVPGTSLAGALRAWLGTVTVPGGGPLFSREALGKVFGDLTARTQDGQVCRIRVADAVADGDAVVEIRDGVGIDRGTGTAAAGILYQHEAAAPGTRFVVSIVADQTHADPERVGEALDLLVAALASGHVEIGAARTRGLGQVRLTEVRRARIDLTDRAEALAWLCGQRPPAPEPAPPSTAPLSDGKLGIEIGWSPVTPVMVKASTVNEPEPASDRAVDTVPLRTKISGQYGSAQLLLPGSSIKGVVRSHAERIMRTLLGDHDLSKDWLDQVNDPRLGPVGTLFGFAGDHPAAGAPSIGGANSEGDGSAGHGEAGEPAGRERSGRRGALSVHDCHGTMTADRVVTHVAIDRWTGGAAENLLFSVREPAAADWQPMRMSLDVRRVNNSADGTGSHLACALLLLVLRDLADGWLAIGFGGTRGRGTISVSHVAFTGSGLPEPWAALCGRTLSEVTADPPEPVRQAFASWRKAMH